MAWHQHNDKWYSSQYFTFEVELCKDVVVEGLSELDDACRKVAERNSKPSMEISIKKTNIHNINERRNEQKDYAKFKTWMKIFNIDFQFHCPFPT